MVSIPRDANISPWDVFNLKKFVIKSAMEGLAPVCLVFRFAAIQLYRKLERNPSLPLLADFAPAFGIEA